MAVLPINRKRPTREAGQGPVNEFSFICTPTFHYFTPKPCPCKPALHSEATQVFFSLLQSVSSHRAISVYTTVKPRFTPSLALYTLLLGLAAHNHDAALAKEMWREMQTHARPPAQGRYRVFNGPGGCPPVPGPRAGGDVLPDSEALRRIVEAVSEDAATTVEIFDVIHASQLPIPPLPPPTGRSRTKWELREIQI